MRVLVYIVLKFSLRGLCGLKLLCILSLFRGVWQPPYIASASNAITLHRSLWLALLSHSLSSCGHPHFSGAPSMIRVFLIGLFFRCTFNDTSAPHRVILHVTRDHVAGRRRGASHNIRGGASRRTPTHRRGRAGIVEAGRVTARDTAVQAGVVGGRGIGRLLCAGDRHFEAARCLTKLSGAVNM